MATKSIYLTSTRGSSGKSAIAIGSYLLLKESKYKPGYFKPIGDSQTMEPQNLTDKDVSTISVVISRAFPKEIICPQFLTPGYCLDEIFPDETPTVLEKILDAYNQIASKSEIILVEGNHFYAQYSMIDLDDLHLAKALGSKLVICAPISDDNDLNSVIMANRMAQIHQVPVLGAILSGITPYADTRIETIYKPLLTQHGIKFLGGLKNAKQLERPTIAEIMEAVTGKLLVGDYIKIKNQFIESFAIGAMGTDSALSFLRKNYNQCIITGGDRGDLILAALEINTVLMILTGNLQPETSVIKAAEKKGVPLVLTAMDTYSVTESLKKIHTHIQPEEIEECRTQVEQHIAWKTFLQ